MIIKVGGREYQAESNGIRFYFVKNPDHYLVKEMSSVFGGTGTSDPNAMALEFSAGKFSLFDYAEMNIGMGYSIEGFLELHEFFDIRVECDIPALCREGRDFEENDFLPSDGEDRRKRDGIPQIGEIWRHTVKGDDYLILGFIYNTITDEVDVEYSSFEEAFGYITPKGPKFGRQIKNHEKAFTTPNADGTPRFIKIK